MRRLLTFLILGLFLVGCAGIGQERKCAFCFRPLQEKTHYQIVLDSGETKEVCCPRCGLHFQEGRDDVRQARVTDFSTGQMFPAEQAIFVEGSSYMPCCEEAQKRDQSGNQFALSWDRCMPSLVAFRDATQAEGFRKQHGGVIKSHSQVMLEIEAPQPNRGSF